MNSKQTSPSPEDVRLQMVHETRLECARAVCFYCGDLEHYKPAELEGNLWLHRLVSKLDTSYRVCVAAAIHDLEAGAWLSKK